jgi:glycosyltransferase involved in cell wall biosynthesis
LLINHNYSETKVTLFAGCSGVSKVARILPLASLLETNGFKTQVVSTIFWHGIVKEKLAIVFSTILTHQLYDYLNTLIRPPKLVIISRIATPQMYLFQKLLQHRGVKVIFDLDDNRFLPMFAVLGTKLRPGSFLIERAVQKADFVTVNGHYLQESVKPLNGNVAIIPEPIDTTQFRPILEKNNSKITILWEGNPYSHYNNLALLIKPFIRLSKKYNIRFKMISSLGDVKVKEMFRNLEKSMEIDYGIEDWVPVDNYSKLLSDSASDIMVAPLQKTAWNEGKSALRVGWGMAMGIPVVASPVGEQKYVIKHGINGLLAKNEEEWCSYLKMLIEDDRLRRSMGRSARDTAEKEFSCRVVGKKLCDIVVDLIE